MRNLGILYCCISVIIGAKSVLAFAPGLSSPQLHPATHTLCFAFYNDFEELGDGEEDNTSDDLYAALRQRQSTLQSTRKRDMQAWKVPPVETSAFPLMNDFVRRVAMDVTAVGVTSTSSYAIVGGDSGSLYLIDLSARAENEQEIEENMMLGTLHQVHEGGRGEEDESGLDSARSRALEALYGEFDGGGIIALAMQDNIVASAGREGGVHISRISQDTNGKQKKELLKAVGKIPELKSFVTSLAFDQTGRLWTGSYEEQGAGTIRTFDNVDKSDAKKLNPKPKYTIHTDSAILSLFLAADIDCGVASTKNHGVLLFSTTDGSVLDKWNPFENRTAEEDAVGVVVEPEFARTAIFLQNDEASEEAEASWSVIIGGSKGSMYQRKINIDAGKVSPSFPFDGPGHRVPETIQMASLVDTVKHQGSIVALASPGPEILLSASQDGTIRVWDCSYRQEDSDDLEERVQDEDGRTKPSFLFAMSGFKVWLGSMIVLKSNLNMLVSDGADNTVVALIFKNAEDIE